MDGMVECIDTSIDGWVDGWMDMWMNGWYDICLVYNYLKQQQ